MGTCDSVGACQSGRVPLPDPPLSDDVVIRHRAAADLDACVALLRRTHERDRYPVNWPADPVAFLTPPDELVTWVATRDGALVGHVMLAAASERLAGQSASADVPLVGSEHLLLLRLLFVAAEARGMRLGTRLLDLATGEATARGCRTVLEVLSLNVDAIAMYERSGWTAVGTTTPDWAPDGTHAVVYLAP
jgi:ribosomal protein S18 acetylase RimI-like enzyme